MEKIWKFDILVVFFTNYYYNRLGIIKKEKWES